MIIELLLHFYLLLFEVGFERWKVFFKNAHFVQEQVQQLEHFRFFLLAFVLSQLLKVDRDSFAHISRKDFLDRFVIISVRWLDLKGWRQKNKHFTWDQICEKWDFLGDPLLNSFLFENRTFFDLLLALDKQLFNSRLCLPGDVYLLAIGWNDFLWKLQNQALDYF